MITFFNLKFILKEKIIRQTNYFRSFEEKTNFLITRIFQENDKTYISLGFLRLVATMFNRMVNISDIRIRNLNEMF